MSSARCRLETVEGRRVANGARQPVPCRRTCDDECTSAELCLQPLNDKVAASRRASSTFNTGTCAEPEQRGQSVHRFVHHQTQFKLHALCHRQPMQPIANQAGDVRVFSCTAKHPCRSIHHTLQTVKSIVRQSSEKAVTVVNPADYKAVE